MDNRLAATVPFSLHGSSSDDCGAENNCVTCPGRSDSVLDGVPDHLTCRFRSRDYDRGEVLFQQGDAAREIYCLGEGFVKIERRDATGKRTVIGLGKTGDLLGADFLMGSTVYPETVIALGSVRACKMPAEVFRQQIRESPELSLNLINYLHRRLNESRIMFCRLSRNNNRSKIADVLLTLAEFFGEEQADGILIRAWLSRDDMASLAGTVKESFIRHLKEFKEEGILETQRRNICVANIKKLEEIAQRDRLIF